MQTASELSDLARNLTDIHDDVGYFSTPLEEVHDLLAKVQALLSEPKDIDGKLHEILEVLQQLETLCQKAEWIPEVGEDAQAAANALQGINAFIKETRAALSEIETALKPMQDWLKDLQKPVDRGWKAISNVESTLETGANAAASLNQHYAGSPPREVEDCAARLNGPVGSVAKPLNDAKDEAGAQLAKAEEPLRVVERQIDRITAFTAIIDRVYAELSPLRQAVKSIAAAVAKAAAYGEKEIKQAISGWAKTFAPNTYRKVTRLLAEAKAEIRRLINRVAAYAFEPVRRAVSAAKEEIAAKIKSLPAVKALETALARASEEIEKVDAAFEALPEACRKLFSGGATAVEV